MRGRLRFRTWRRPLELDIDRIDALVRHFDPTSVFTLARELCSRNVYLRAFRPFDASGATVVDLGANRGLFSALIIAAARPSRALAVEPQPDYLPALAALTEGAGTEVVPVTAFVGVHDAKGGSVIGDLPAPLLRMSDILPSHERAAFVKIDIEGGEEALITGEPEWLGRAERIALEVHPAWCDVGAVFDALRAAGLTVYCSDDVGREVAPEVADFIYAAHDPAALRPRFRPRGSARR